MEILSATAVLLIVCVIFLILNITWNRRQQGKGKLPPGPTPLPILGNVLQLKGNEVFKSLIELSKKYGPVYTIHLGMEPVVVMCSYDIVKEALSDKGEVFGDRGYMPLLEKISGGGHGVVGSNGECWRQMRRFSVITLRNFGMGKRSIEERIQEEAQFLTEEFRKTKSQPVDPTYYISKAVANVICSVVFGKRFEYEDKEFLQLLGFLHQTFRYTSCFLGQLYNMFPKVMSKLPGVHNMLSNSLEGAHSFIIERIKRHQETLDPSSPRDFIDCFLIKMEQEKDEPQSEFHIKNAIHTTFDLFGAGTETVSTTLRYGLMLLLKHPEVEERVHKEIDQVIGRDRAPCIDDRSHMPYTEAVIHEIQRFIDVLPLALPHKVACDTHFRDYVIPKGTTVYPILSSVLKDPKLFRYPDQFHPGHFLDENGKFYRNEGYMPFSSGKRICPGEGLARMELFLLLTTLLQNFTLTSVVDIEDLDLTPESSAFGKVPRPYQLCFIPR
ncbi:cytochrome P450 2C19-like [Rhinophrynus dorsalis]